MDNTQNPNMKRTQIILVFLVALCFVPIFFQNCAAPLEEDEDLGSLAATAPFAFEHKLSHFAYMSCSGMPAGYDQKTYFTFKTGDYTNGGIKLNSAFVNHVKNVNVNGKASTLEQSEINKNAYLTMAVRPTTNLQSGLSSKTPSTFIGLLTDPGVASLLAQNNGSSYLRYFPSLTGQKWLESTFQFTTNEVEAQQIRNMLNNDGYITTNYNYGKDPAIAAISPDSSSSKIYGLGYKAKINTRGFGLTKAFDSGALRIMTNLREYDLTTGFPTSSIWDCKEEWRFMIIRATDGNVDELCPGYKNSTAPTSGPLLEMFLALKQIMPTWGVNLAKRCIVPLDANAGQCYGAGTLPINYSGGTCDPALGTCPHYVSICKKR